MPFSAAVALIAIMAGFTSGALPIDTHKPVDLHKLSQGQAVYKVNS